MPALRAAICFLLALAGAGCGKDKPAAATAAADAAAPGQLSADAGPTAEDDEKLATAFHAIRCALVGSKLVDENLYRAHGHADAAGFAEAFEARATARPDWARTVVEKSYATPCSGDLALPPATPTPTAPAP